MTPERILAALRTLGVSVRVGAGRTLVLEPPDGIPQELKDHATAQREALVDILCGNGHRRAEPPLDPPRLTDVGNARRFAEQHREDVRFCYGRRAWLVWDDTCWRWDHGDLVAARAKATARRLYAEAARIPEDDEESKARRKAVSKWAGYSESEPGIRRMLELAKSEPGIPVTLDQLDADPWMLNCPNGTLELRTGHLREHRRGDMITKVTAAPYEAEARHPVLDSFLDRVLPDEDVRAFTQRVAGYALTGSTREEKLFIAHGPTAGGKSTLLTGLRRAMGDYATTADAQTFMERRVDGGAPRDDLVKLIGRRLVVSSEVKDGSRMAETLVKTLFGGDDMSARALYERTIEFTPVFKLMIAANHRPKARDDDDALWRRIVEIPFTVSIPEGERDPAVKTTLTDPDQTGAALLAWAVEGCAAWLAEGLKTPDAVRQATKAYRDSMDPTGDFLTERCVIEEKATVSVAALWAAYEAWVRAEDVKPIGRRAFNARLKARGCEQFQATSGDRSYQWRGIKLRTETDPAPPGPEPQHSQHSQHTAQDSPYTRAREESYGNSAANASSASSASATPHDCRECCPRDEVVCTGCRAPWAPG